MKVPRLRMRKKLRASTARRSMAAPEMDYEEMSEPNMKLSRALLIVLVLHVVAVAGIIAFNTIKTRQGALPPAGASATAGRVQPGPSVSPSIEPALPAVVAHPAPAPAREEIKAALPVGKPGAKEESSKGPALADGGKVYVVAKGDNPVSIAKKLKVSQSDLLSVNHIDDPRKLQIGQKLIIPQRKSASAKGKKSTND